MGVKMVCTKCGAKLKEGYVYCHECGTSIQIVPNFDPLIEDRMDKTLSEIKEEVLLPVENVPIREPKKLSKNIVIGGSLGVLILVGLILLSFFIIKQNGFDAHMSKGESYFEDGKFALAISQYQQALQKDESSIDARMRLAEGYRMMGKNQKALDTLMQVIELDASNEEAYQLMIAIYEQTEDYIAINKLLGDCKVESIYQKFKEYLALPPEFSAKEGTYQECIVVKLMTDNQGSIYYTTDGTEPSIESLPYTSPITLEPGKNIIRAIFVNQKGMISESTSSIYEIDVTNPTKPLVTPQSGEFSRPEFIVATCDTVDSNIYYTTDGSEPDETSFLYQGQLPMPIGKSTFRFIAFSKDHLPSEEEKVSFHLNLIGKCTKEEAENFVVASLMATGELLDFDGSVSDLEGKYHYKCTTAAKTGIQTCYLIDEYYVDTDGIKNKTGKIYAVDADKLTLYRAQRKTDGTYDFQLFY